MQHSCVRVGIDELDAPFALEATQHLSLEQAGIHARVEDAQVILVGNAPEATTRHLWQVALLNERMVDETDPRRVEILQSLVA